MDICIGRRIPWTQGMRSFFRVPNRRAAADLKRLRLPGQGNGLDKRKGRGVWLAMRMPAS